MNLKRQLLLVSLLTLVLPWAGCEFISETESALRAGQQQMLSGTARAIAESLQQYGEDFPRPSSAPEHILGARLYAHALTREPTLDGYFDDWALSESSLESMRGIGGSIVYAAGTRDEQLYVYISVTDTSVVYAERAGAALDDGPPYSDRVSIISSSPPYLNERIEFAPEAPGNVVAYRETAFGIAAEPTIQATWQDVPRGYQLEARIPLSILGTHVGLIIGDTPEPASPPVRSSNFASQLPGRLATIQPDLQSVVGDLIQPGMRLLLTDAEGWRIANVGELQTRARPTGDAVSAWLRFTYDALVEKGTDARLSEPAASGREQQPYIQSALAGETAAGWYRSAGSGSAVVAVAVPVDLGDAVVGAVVLQQGTEEILSLTNQGLARLLNITLLTTVVVAAVLLGYATWLSRRIRRLSFAADDALDSQTHDGEFRLPSHDASDELGDLSRRFSFVLQQISEYNEYLRTLASKLSHELRTPLAIVTSSLENLEHEQLNEASARYTARAKDGADRLRKILGAMSEANRVEELVRNADAEVFDLKKVVGQAVSAYAGVFPERRFLFKPGPVDIHVLAAPELIVQMLDKLVDNAVDFSQPDDEIVVRLSTSDDEVDLSVTNPGPPLPETMRTQLFDSLVSVRSEQDDHHLGLGLFIARLIAEGHDGRIRADNVDDGVCFTVTLPTRQDAPGGSGESAGSPPRQG
ncbi:MAG: ATP-binding protein [Woeseiaceae bacterium]|nr:ATP-binding protein [Woeseiaceae bacterium]